MALLSPGLSLWLSPHSRGKRHPLSCLSKRRWPFWNADILKGLPIPGVLYLAAVPAQRLRNCKPSAWLLELLSNRVLLPVPCGASGDFSPGDGSLGVI